MAGAKFLIANLDKVYPDPAGGLEGEEERGLITVYNHDDRHQKDEEETKAWMPKRFPLLSLHPCRICSC